MYILYSLCYFNNILLFLIIYYTSKLLMYFCSLHFRCAVKECDSYPVAPQGYKIIAVKADDCCYSYNQIKDNCNETLCPNSKPECQYYEDLQMQIYRKQENL